MRIYESQEDYLEKILMLSREKSVVRSVDVARALNVSKPSVSHAMKLLREKGYIVMDANNLITLTEAGEKIAQTMLDRHMFLAHFFISLGVDEQTAFEDACRIEHDISPDTFRAICRLADEKKSKA